MANINLPDSPTNEKKFIKNKKVYSMANQYYFTLNNTPTKDNIQSL